MVQSAADTFVSRQILGTANQITVTDGDGVAGNIQLSLPQDIDTGAAVEFATLTLTDAVNQLVLGAVQNVTINASGLLGSYTLSLPIEISPDNDLALVSDTGGQLSYKRVVTESVS